MKVFTLAWWRYVLDDSRADKGCANWLARVMCRWRGHPAGVWFYNVGGLEPDYRCKGCGEDLG